MFMACWNALLFQKSKEIMIISGDQRVALEEVLSCWLMAKGQGRENKVAGAAIR